MTSSVTHSADSPPFSPCATGTLLPMSETDAAMSFEAFRSSFSYGERSDLNFKFLKSTPDREASEFFRVLLERLGDAYDNGDVRPLIDAAIEAQIAGYAPREGVGESTPTYESGPFAPFDGTLPGATVCLVNSGGHYVAGDDPKPLGVEDMTQDEAITRISEFLKAAPLLSEIPSDLPPDAMRTRHGGYDTTSALVDRNVCFPLDRLAEMRDEGRIGALAPTSFSFPGSTAQGRLKAVIPGWIDRFVGQHPDVMLLVPV